MTRSRHSRERFSRNSDEPEDDGDEDEMEEEPQLDTSMKHAIIVDGLPVVEMAKRDKLLNVVRKFFSQVGTIIENGLEMPFDEAGKSLGFAFIEFESEQQAAAAITKANGYKLDKAHTFIVNSFEDHAKYMAVPDEEVEFEPPPYVPKESLLHWLEDANARDQVCVPATAAAAPPLFYFATLKSHPLTSSLLRSTSPVTTTRPRSGGTTQESPSVSQPTPSTSGWIHTSRGRLAGPTSRPSIGSASCYGAGPPGRSCRR